VDGLGFRYRWATDGLREEDYLFQPSSDSMTMRELLKHIFRLVSRSYESLSGEMENFRDSYTLEDIRKLTLDKISKIRVILEDMEDEQLACCTITSRGKMYPLWNIIHGPLCDAITHVGQVNSWRRLNGNPIPEVSVFLGEPGPRK
jgi:hypothetical protein